MKLFLSYFISRVENIFTLIDISPLFIKFYFLICPLKSGRIMGAFGRGEFFIFFIFYFLFFLFFESGKSLNQLKWAKINPHKIKKKKKKKKIETFERGEKKIGEKEGKHKDWRKEMEERS